MLNLKNNENDAVYSMKFAKKKAKIKIKFQKMKGTYFFELHHPLVEKSPIATVVYSFY